MLFSNKLLLKPIKRKRKHLVHREKPSLSFFVPCSSFNPKVYHIASQYHIHTNCFSISKAQSCFLYLTFKGSLQQLPLKKEADCLWESIVIWRPLEKKLSVRSWQDGWVRFLTWNLSYQAAKQGYAFCVWATRGKYVERYLFWKYLSIWICVSMYPRLKGQISYYIIIITDFFYLCIL